MRNKELINPEEAYIRIINNMPYGNNLTPYTKKVLNYLIDFFRENEEYEKCEKLKKFIEIRFNHDLNFKMKKTKKVKFFQ